MNRGIGIEDGVVLSRDLGALCPLSLSPVMYNSLGPHGLSPTRLLCPWDFPSKNTGVGCHFLLQEIPNQESGSLCHWQADSLPLCHLGSPIRIELLFKVIVLHEISKEDNIKKSKGSSLNSELFQY